MNCFLFLDVLTVQEPLATEFELSGILLACAIGFMKIPLKTKMQASTIIWGLLLIAATIEVTISEALLKALT